jgi:hypothetical protein
MQEEKTDNQSSGQKCLNCGTPLADRFCTHCGQDSREIKKSVWNFFLQFFENFTDLDNRLWSSLFPLLFKPGYLTVSYLEGKRKRYLNPIQLYAFFSFLFFLSVYYLPESEGVKSVKDEILQDIQENNKRDSLHSHQKDSIGTRIFNLTMELDSGDTDPNDGSIVISGISTRYETYDSIQNTLPPEKRHGLFARNFFKKLLFFNKKAKENDSSLVKDLIDSFKDNMPTVLTLLLPISALFLQILYFRRGLFYVEHLVLTLHFHSACFFYMTICEVALLIFPILNDYSEALVLVSFIYVFLAMKSFYGQGVLKTSLKFLIFLGSYLVLLLLGTICNVLVAAWKVA